MAHTPGPWTKYAGKYSTDRDDYKPVIVQTDEHHAKFVAIVPLADNPEAEDDANLIAAAPELLEALRGIITDIDSQGELSGIVGRYVSTEYYERAKSALAKAEGK